MNPYEENDPKDPGSYMNASLWARVVTIAAGPLTNYFFASVLFFMGFMVAGNTVTERTSMRLNVDPEGAAYAAQIRDGDKVLAVNDVPMANWEQLKEAVSAHPGEPIDMRMERDGKEFRTKVTPSPKGDKFEGKIRIGPYTHNVPVSVGEAAVLSLVEPPKVVYALVYGLGQVISRKEKLELSGPVGITKEVARAVELGPGSFLQMLAMLSAYLGGFNLLPVPALDGGRLIFLMFEGIARRKPDAKVEARVHALGLLMMLTLIAVVTYGDFMKH
jgi:regulator of sigma E protease